ncbi:MAG TPA: dihydrofolate reductase [Desulfobacteraceae bacterium]|nr:dihydrofolate reductase [Deltaproteobacteria bacterium]RLB97160.1 MAG: dihydrofolate reductase [Deltaproteobacteria bacterium]HDI58778.1 dihydrofolate reductase [Desulfobacteraceae bacterium]
MKLILLMAQTVDGKIARDSDHFPDWTASADKRFFAARTREAGVVIMGSRTFDTLGQPLPGRKNVILTRNAERVSRPPDLVFTDDPPAQLLARLASEGHAEAILAGGARINSLFAAEHLIDEIIVTISPRLFGSGLSLFDTSLDLSLQLLEVRRLDADLVLLNYRVIR